jgi:hypothetical protein
MPTSKRKLILLALLERLAAIRTTDDYATDAGLNVQLGPLPAVEDDPQPRVALIVGDVPNPDNKDLQSAEIRRWAFTAVARIAVDPNDPLADLATEDLVADLHRALFVPGGQDLGGLAVDVETAGVPKTDPREAGATTVGCTVPFVVVYAADYGEA